MTILALDLGTICGWALRTHAGIHSGSEKFAKREKDHIGDRLLRFAQWLTSMKGDGVELVVYEKAVGHYASLGAQQLFPHFEGVLMLWCARHQVPMKPVNQSTLKKWATGWGRSDKAAVETAVRGLGYKPADSNEADALALLLTETGALKATPRPKPPRKPKVRANRGAALPLDNKPPF